MPEPTQQSLTPKNWGDVEISKKEYGAVLERFDVACASGAVVDEPWRHGRVSLAKVSHRGEILRIIMSTSEGGPSHDPNTTTTTIMLGESEISEQRSMIFGGSDPSHQRGDTEEHSVSAIVGDPANSDDLAALLERVDHYLGRVEEANERQAPVPEKVTPVVETRGKAAFRRWFSGQR